jgi:hypothetical protein
MLAVFRSVKILWSLPEGVPLLSERVQNMEDMNLDKFVRSYRPTICDYFVFKLFFTHAYLPCWLLVFLDLQCALI